MPRVSIVTPCYNGADFIADTIRSIMAQTYTDWEHIIVNDASKDNSVEVIRRFPHVQLLEMEKNGGPARALNCGYRHASGELLAWCSADDGYLPIYLEQAVAYLDNHPNTVCVGAGAYFVDPEGNILAEYSTGKRSRIGPHEILKTNPIHGSSTLFPRRIYEQLGGFREDFIGTPDTDMWVRMLELGEIGLLPDPITYCTRHPNQDSRLRTHLVVENLQKLIDATVERVGRDALIPVDYVGNRDGASVEAAGWYSMAQAFAPTALNPLAPECIARARKLDPANSRYKLRGTLLTPLGALKFRLRAKVVPYVVRYRAAQSKKAGRNVHRMVREHLEKRDPFVMAAAPSQTITSQEAKSA